MLFPKLPHLIQAPQSQRLKHKMRCAVIDIGSNTVRLVIYEVFDGAFGSIWNEKITARLGHGLNETGHLNPEGVTLALNTLSRFKHIIASMDVRHSFAVATAAVRAAADGPEFAKIASTALGVKLDVISAKMEARLAYLGTKGVIPDLNGLVLDMGGRSLEVVATHTLDWESLDIGPLSQPSSDPSPTNTGNMTADTWMVPAIRNSHVLSQPTKNLYLVGGSWRALAKFFQFKTDYPIKIIHRYELASSAVVEIINKTLALLNTDPEAVTEEFSRILGKRASQMPHAFRTMRTLIEATQCEKLIWSAGGLREGVLFEKKLISTTHIKSEIRNCVQNFALPEDVTRALCAFVQPVLGGVCPSWANACANALLKPRDFHQGHRASFSVNWAINAPIFNLSHTDRIMFGIALGARLNRYERLKIQFEGLISPLQIKMAFTCGVLTKFAYEWAAHDPSVLHNSALSCSDRAWVLQVNSAANTLLAPHLREKLDLLAEVLDIDLEIKVL